MTRIAQRSRADLAAFEPTMATTLEAAPAAFGAAHLQASGWGPDKHVGA